MSYSELGYIKVAAASCAVTLADVASNVDAILDQAKILADQNVSIAAFPELCLSGYSAEDLFFNETLLQEVERGLARLCEQNPLPLIAVGAAALAVCNDPALVVGNGKYVLSGWLPEEVPVTRRFQLKRS